MVDSGGFALSTKETCRWTWREVAEQMSRIDADIFVSLDYPPHLSDSKERRWKKINASMRNFGRLSEVVKDKIVMPVIHGRTVPEIELSIRLLSEYGKKFGWVGLGGMVPLLQHRRAAYEVSSMTAEVFMGAALSLIRQTFPDSMLHVFGAGGTRTFPAVYALGADPGDSIGWRQAAGFGSIFLPLQSQRAVRWNRKNGAPRKTLSEADLSQLQRCGCSICMENPMIGAKVKAFRRGFYERAIHNAWTISNQFRAWPKKRACLLDAVADGALGPAWSRAAQMRRRDTV
jgi:queuine/archaeosine tRNA-ribosyltransferase